MNTSDTEGPKCGGRGRKALVPAPRNGVPKMHLLAPFCLSLPHNAFRHYSTAQVPYPKAGAVRVSTNETKTIAGNILASHSKSDDGGGVPGQEVLVVEQGEGVFDLD